MRPVACALATALLAAACGGGPHPSPARRPATGPAPRPATRPAKQPAVVSEGFHVAQRDGIAVWPETTIADDVLGADLDRARLALAVYRAPGTDPAHGSWVVLVGRSDGRALRVVDTGGAGEEEADRRASPTFAAGALYWTASNDEPAGPPNARVRRLDLRTRAVTERPVAGYLLSVAADAVRPVAPLLISADDGANDPSVEWYGTAIVRAIPRTGFR